MNLHLGTNVVSDIEDTIPVLDNYGFVRLDALMADDLSVVNSARVSFHTHRDAMGEGDTGLINYLMKNRHGTPFEHNAFRFHVSAPLFIFREWQRHRIGSFNEWSARYSKLESNFYIPTYENIRVRVGKPGHYTYEAASSEVAMAFYQHLLRESHENYRYYDTALKEGIAPEQARFFLPVNIYSEMYWTVNARSLMNFLSLRDAPTAMWEIQQFAKAIKVFFQRAMPVTYAAFVENGRIAP